MLTSWLCPLCAQQLQLQRGLTLQAASFSAAIWCTGNVTCACVLQGTGDVLGLSLGLWPFSLFTRASQQVAVLSGWLRGRDRERESNVPASRMQPSEVSGGAAGEAVPPDNPKRVLILMADTGGGHRASAQALKDGFQQTFGSAYKVRLAL